VSREQDAPERLHQALLRHPALIVTDRRGRRSTADLVGEEQPPRCTPRDQALPDGPEGHVTRTSILRLAQDLSRDLAPDRIEPADEARVLAWISTPEYVEGSERVLEMQRRNRRG
jgi:hypothetical protein